MGYEKMFGVILPSFNGEERKVALFGVTSIKPNRNGVIFEYENGECFQVCSNEMHFLRGMEIFYPSDTDIEWAKVSIQYQAYDGRIK